MFQDKELELLQSIIKKSLNFLIYLKENPKQLVTSSKTYFYFGQYLQNLNKELLKNPDQIKKALIAYWKDVFILIDSSFNSWSQGSSLPIKDQRFSHEEWVKHPFFNLLSQHYILLNEHIDNLLNSMEHDDIKASKRLQFVTKNYLNALSPANFLHTNPQVLSQILNTKGSNLLQGLEHFLSDLEKNPSHLMVSMSPPHAFKLGKNLAKTKGRVIFRNSIMELIQYTAQTSTVKAIPLLIIPPWINKYYILDLSSDNSLVNWLIAQGITVFIISWINPCANLAKTDLFDYLEQGPKTALSVIKKQMQVKKVNALGFCIGGTLLALLLAYNKAHGDHSIKSATFLATLIDFSDAGDLSIFIDEHYIQKLEEEMESSGFLSGKLMASSFNALKANDLIWSFFIKNYLQGKKPEAFDILFWNADSTNMPAAMHSQYLRWMYLENNLVKPGGICLNNTPIHVEDINIPTFFLSTEKDHIAPWKTTYLGFQLMKGPKRFVLGGSGHIAGIINSPQTNKYYYKTNPSTQLSPEKWLEEAIIHQGSWWPEWLSWLKKYSGKSIPALEFNQLKIKPLGNAPGSYIFKTCE